MISSTILSFLDCAAKLPENRTDADLKIIYDDLKKLETLASFKESTLHSMSHIIRIEKYNKNDLIFRTGELITSWFILIKGLVKIGDQMLHSINKFGRKSHFTNVRSTDCIAVQESEVLIIDYQNIEDPPLQNNFKIDQKNIDSVQTENIQKISKESNKNSHSDDNMDIIVLSDDSFNSELKETKNELEEDDEIICLSDEEDNKANSDTLQSEPILNEDSECIELYSIDKKIPCRPNFNLKNQEVMVRWRVKKRADPNLNLSMSNYKLRAFGNQRPEPERKFRPNIFFDESLIETSSLEEEKLKLDREALEQKINSYSSKFKKITEDYDNFYQQCVDYLDKKYQKNSGEIKYHFSSEKDKLMENNDNWYKNELNRLDIDRNKFMNQARDQKKQTETALKDLYDSGCYVRGKFSEYFILETKQPVTKRSGYLDTGKRYLLLPKNKIKNILIEDLIYEHYYGKP